MIDREKERITDRGVHFLSAGKDKHRRRARRENKGGRGRENTRGRGGMFMCFLFGSNGDSLTPAAQSC